MLPIYIYVDTCVCTSTIAVHLLHDINANATRSPTPIIEAISSKKIRHNLNFFSTKGAQSLSFYIVLKLLNAYIKLLLPSLLPFSLADLIGFTKLVKTFSKHSVSYPLLL